MLNKAAKNLWSTKENGNSCNLLWYYNRHGIAKESNGQRATSNNNNSKNKSWIPTCVKKIEKEIKEIRRDISVATAELKRLQIYGKLTKKGRKNR